MANNDHSTTDVTRVLSDLRGRIRRYVLIEGIALTLAALGGLFWLSLAVDHAWFRISRLELPYWFRAGFDVIVAGLLAFLAVSWIGLRVVRSFRTKALALVLERRFPELNDRLVTAVELAETPSEINSPLSAAMMKRTMSEAARATQQLDLSSVFDRKPLRRAVTAAAVGMASIGGLAFASQSTLDTWRNSFLGLDDEYWNREVALVVRVLAQPGNTPREFRNQSVKHPRGADLTVEIITSDGRKTPDEVVMRYRLLSGRGKGTVRCSSTPDGKFRHTITGLLEDLEFHVYGGDFVNRMPYRVQVVEAPQFESIELACFYPEHTGMKHPESTADNPVRDIVEVRGTQVELPNETEFLLQADSNKPLVRVRVQFGNKELLINGNLAGKSSAEFIERDDDGDTLRVTEPDVTSIENWYLSEDGRELTVPFVLSSLQSDAAKARIDNTLTTAGPPFVLPPDTTLRIYLEDTDDILSAEPARVLVSGIADSEPVVETRLRGIGTSITRKASIPVLGRIVDDYGIADTRFEYQINDDEQWEREDLESRIPESEEGSFIREFELERSKDEKFERFNVAPLDLSLGQRLTLAVVAEDGDDLNGPHVTRGQRFSFKIVSGEELQSLLYQRELNLRAQFERIITETKNTREDLIRHRARVDERKRLIEGGSDEGDADEKLKQIALAVTGCAERSLHQVRKNANETASVALAFEDIREELVNNRLHTPQTLERLDTRIVRPLKAIGEQEYPAIDEAIGLFRLANQRGQDPTATIDTSVQLLSGMITRMEQVLAEMEKLKDFQKAVEELKKIIAEQQGLLDKTKKEQKKQFLRKQLGL